MEEMTASEILRRSADDNWSAGVAGIAMALDAAECNGRVFELLANKIDAELAQARELSLLRGCRAVGQGQRLARLPRWRGLRRVARPLRPPAPPLRGR